MNVWDPAGFFPAKAAAAHSRRQPKDWSGIAFVRLRNDIGGSASAAELVRDRFADETDALAKVPCDLRANFEILGSQVPRVCTRQMRTDHLDPSILAADAVLAVRERGLQRRVD